MLPKCPYIITPVDDAVNLWKNKKYSGIYEDKSMFRSFVGDPAVRDPAKKRGGGKNNPVASHDIS